MNEYLVIALYDDNFQRYATTVQADSPEDAEQAAQRQAVEDAGPAEGFGPQEEDAPLIIAAVLLNGEVVA